MPTPPQASAAFLVNGNPVTGAVAVAAESTVTLALVSTFGVRSTTWTVVGTHSSSATAPTIASGTSTSFTMPAGSGQGYLIECVVNQGIDSEGRRASRLYSRAVVGVVNASGIVPLAVGEKTERSATHGWVGAINEAVDAAGVPSTAARTTLANTTESTAIPVATPISEIGGIINATHYGLDEANDAGDNDTALAAALVAATAAGQLPIFIPPGVYNVSDTWLFENLRGQIVFGAGASASGVRRSTFRWAGEGTSGSSFLRFLGCRDCQVRDVEIVFLGSGSVHVDDVILFENNPGSTSSNNWLVSVYITGTSPTKRYNRGVAWIVGAGTNANNDLCRLERVICTNYIDAAFDITHTQSTGHHFVDCSGGGGDVMLRTVAAFVWENGTSHSGNAVADFQIVGAATTQQTHIYGYRSENSGCLLDVAIGSSTMAISLEDCSFQTTALRADDRMISWVARSYLFVKNCKLGNSTAAAGVVYLGGSAAGNRNAIQAEFHNVRMVTSLANPFSQSSPKFETGCAVETAGGTAYRGTRGAAGPHRSIFASGFRTRTNTTPAWHVRDYPDAVATTDDAPTTVLEIEVPENTAGRASFAVVGRVSTGEIWSAIVDAHVVNSSGTVTISDVTPSYKDPDTLGYSVDLDTSGAFIVVEVTGGAADAVRWSCVPELLTVGLPS